MQASEFFSSLDRSPPYHYFTAPLLALAPELLEHTPGWQALAVGTQQGWLQFWACSEGGITQAHYDVADNVRSLASWVSPPLCVVICGVDRR